jgi:hypothetical protein
MAARDGLNQQVRGRLDNRGLGALYLIERPDCLLKIFAG